MKTVKVRHGSQDHVGSDRRLVVGEVFLEFERLERLRAKLLTLGLFDLRVEVDLLAECCIQAMAGSRNEIVKF